MKFNGAILTRILEVIGIILIPTTLITSLFQLIRLINIDDNLLETKYGLNPSVFFSSKANIVIYVSLMILSSCLVILGLLLFIKLMRVIRSHGIFSDQSIDILKSMNIGILIWAFYNIIATALVFKMMSPKILHNMKITQLLGAVSIGGIFFFIIFSLFTFLISKGNKLKHDQDLTI